MPSVGPGAYEIRVQLGDAYRVFYVAKFKEAVYVLHAFQKKTQKTARGDIEIGRQRYSAVQKPAPRRCVNWRISSSSKVAIMYSKI